MTHIKTLASRLGIPGLFDQLHLLSNEELKELRDKLTEILETNRKNLEPVEVDLTHTDLEDFEFADDEFLSTKEASVFVELFEEMGDIYSASLMRNYIEKMNAYDGNFIKQAGLFRNLMNKLMGFGKRVFFKVYRELYTEAKKAQERLDDRIDQINESYSAIRKDLRYHDLEGWRGGIHSLNLADSSEITSGFDVSYGKLVQYLGLTGKGKEKIPEESGQIGKLPDVGQPEEQEETGEIQSEEAETAESAPETPDHWSRSTPGASEGWSEIARNVAFSPSSGGVRFSKQYFDYLLGKHLSTDGTGNVKYWSSYSEDKQPMQGKLKEMMGSGVWQMQEDENFVYLYPQQRGNEEGAPPVQETTPEEIEDSFEEPEIPKPEGSEDIEELEIEEPEEGEGEEELEEEESFEEELETEPEEEFEEPEIAEKPEPESVEEAPEEPEEAPEQPEPSPVAEMVKKQPARKSVWVQMNKPKRERDGNLWSRFSKVLQNTADRYVKQNRAEIVKDPELLGFLERSVPQQFPGHARNVSKLWMPTDLDKRKEFITTLETAWNRAEKKSYRSEKLKELYKTSVRGKWIK